MESRLFLIFAQQFSGIDGFLGTRGSIMLDIVFLAMFAVVPLMLFNIWLVSKRRAYDLHKKLQILLGVLLLIAVVAFEVDVRFFTDWEERAAPSPYYQPEGWSPVWISLVIHLAFAIPTLFLWIFVMVQALRLFPNPAAPSSHSRAHRLWARLAAGGMTGTAITGWIYYGLAFVA